MHNSNAHSERQIKAELNTGKRCDGESTRKALSTFLYVCLVYELHRCWVSSQYYLSTQS